MSVSLVIFNIGSVISQRRDFGKQQLISLAKRFASPNQLSELDAMAPLPFPELREKLIPKNGEDQEIVGQLRHEFNHEMRSYYRNAPEVGEAEGVKHTFTVLKESGIRVVLCSQFDHHAIQPVLDRMGWVRSRLIDACVTNDDVIGKFPYPEMIYRAMTLTGVTSLKQVFRVGNTPADIRQGKDTGCRCTIGIAPETNHMEAMERERPTHMIEEVSEVLDILHFGGYFQFTPATQHIITAEIGNYQFQALR